MTDSEVTAEQRAEGPAADRASLLGSGSRVTVTGAAGFIGSHLCRALLDRGVGHILAIDHLGYGAWESLETESESLRCETLDFSQLGVDQLAELLQGCDCLFHLAAEKHNQSKDDPERVLEVNVAGTHRLLRAAARAGVSKIVFTSSLYAYGRLHGPPMRESDLPEPWTVYGISKLAGEKLLLEVARLGVDCTSLRLFFVYGPGQFAGRGYKSVIVSNFERILRGEAPAICGDGKQALDYVYVDDVVDALLRAAECRGRPGPYNIGSGQALSIAELTTRMLRAAGSGLEPVHVEADWTAGSLRVCDASLAKRDLGWEPRVGLEEGLARVVEWMKSREEAA